MDTEVLGQATLEAGASEAPRSSIGRTARDHFEKLLVELVDRFWDHGSRSTANPT